MEMGDIVSMMGQIATPVAIFGGIVALYFALRRPIYQLKADSDEKFDRLDTKIERLEEKLSHELSEFRLETQTLLARHDERLAAIERQRPQLQLR